jgi:hypothetical protein
MMTEIFAEGDLLLDWVPDVSSLGTVSQNAEGAPMVLAEGEDRHLRSHPGYFHRRT